MEDQRPILPESTPLKPTDKGSSAKWSERLQDHVANFYSAKSQKRRLYFCAAVWGLFTGMERAIIFPTLWLYFFKIFNLQAAVTYYGITLAAFNLSILITSPIYGYLGYRGVPVRILLLISNQLEIVGNVIYFVAGAPWLVLIGRFVAGLGGGSEVSLYADIVRATTKAERTPIIVILLLTRQFGLIAGPAATLILDPIDVKVGKISFNVYNMPGLFMAIAWAVHTIFLVLFYPTVEQPTEDVLSSPTESLSDTDKKSEVDEEEKSKKKRKDVFRRRASTVRVKELGFRDAIHYYLKWEISATVVTTFACYFCLMALEAVLPPLAKTFFNWNEVQTSWVYLVCGVSVIGIYFLLRFLSNYIEDRNLLIGGLIGSGVGYLYMMGLLIGIDSTRKILFIVLVLVGVGFHVVAQPFVLACSESLYTKLIPMTDLDRGQSYYRLVINVAILIGPYVGGSLQQIPYVVFLLMFVSIGLSAVICIVAYPQMRRSSTDDEKSDIEKLPNTTNAANESTEDG